MNTKECEYLHMKKCIILCYRCVENGRSQLSYDTRQLSIPNKLIRDMSNNSV